MESPELVRRLLSDASWESCGQFRVSLEKMLEQVGGLANQEPGQWLLFGVQAASQWGCARVELGPTALEMVFAEAPPELQQDWWKRPDRLSPPLVELNRALLWAQALRPRILVLHWESPQGGYRLQVRTGECQALGPSAQTRLAVEVEWPNSRLGRQMVQGARWALAFCPVPVYAPDLVQTGCFDELAGRAPLGFRLIRASARCRSRLACRIPVELPALAYEAWDRLWERGRPGKIYRVEVGGERPGEEPMQWGPGEAPADSLVLGRWADPQGRVETVWIPGGAAPLAGLASSLTGARAVFYRARGAISQLWLVRNGCRLRPVDLKVPEGWWVALAANSVSTDVSGVVPIQDSALAALREWTESQIRGFHARMASAPNLAERHSSLTQRRFFVRRTERNSQRP